MLFYADVASKLRDRLREAARERTEELRQLLFLLTFGNIIYIYIYV